MMTRYEINNNSSEKFKFDETLNGQIEIIKNEIYQKYSLHNIEKEIIKAIEINELGLLKAKIINEDVSCQWHYLYVLLSYEKQTDDTVEMVNYLIKNNVVLKEIGQFFRNNENTDSKLPTHSIQEINFKTLLLAHFIERTKKLQINPKLYQNPIAFLLRIELNYLIEQLGSFMKEMKVDAFISQLITYHKIAYVLNECGDEQFKNLNLSTKFFWYIASEAKDFTKDCYKMMDILCHYNSNYPLFSGENFFEYHPYTQDTLIHLARLIPKNIDGESDLWIEIFEKIISSNNQKRDELKKYKNNDEETYMHIACRSPYITDKILLCLFKSCIDLFATK